MSSIAPVTQNNQANQDNQEVKTNNWSGFGKSIVSAFVITFIWAIIGCNFMFLQRYVVDGGEYLGTLFPDDPNKPPYSDGSQSPRIVRDFKTIGLKKFANMKSKKDAKMPINIKRSSAKAGSDTNISSSSVSQQATPIQQKKTTEKTPLLQAVNNNNNVQNGGGDVDPKRTKFFKKLTNFDEYSSPYNWKSGQPGLVGDFKAWIAESIEFSYTNGRSLINKMFETGDMLTESMSPILVLLLSVPIVGLLLSIVPIYGFLSTLVGEFQAPNNGWIWGLVFLFLLGFDFILAGVVGFWQTLQVLATFFLLPLIVNASDVFSIMGEHYTFFTGMFGFLVVANAFAFLKIEASLVMFLTYLYLVWKSWKEK